MGHHSLQVCMDDASSDWFQGTMHEEGGMDSSSSPSPIVDILARPPGLMERRLRPPHDLSLKCPRCDSTNTKFCYYNNYSLTQPRYFCKTCRRYWTKGGTLRNIPVGGGCRKNKKVVTKKSSDQNALPSSSSPAASSSFVHEPGATDLQLSSGLHFPVEMQLSYLMGDHSGNPGFMGGRYNGMFEFMDSKYENLVEGSASRSYDFMGNGGDHMGLIGGMNNTGMGLGPNFHALCPPPFGMAYDENVINEPNSFMETNSNSQRLLLPPNYNNPSDDNNQLVEVKPNPKILALGWQDQGCFDAGKDSYGSYINGMGSWPGLMNGYGSSTSTNPMV